ncbi:MAG TPA: serine--tRNA ligase [Gemmatimonadaceae bacterium]|jgi:seryl-tRNA synthetase|nr:serine--tRNA ligase [Gemmatimonadaceae bacterium]
MHDLRLVRERLDALREGMRRRNMLDATTPLLDRAEVLERERRLAIQAVEERKAARNSLTQAVAQRKREGQDATDLMDRARALGEEITTFERSLEELEQELTSIVLQLPNINLPEVPDGGEEHNAVQRSWGEPRPAESVKPHWEIGTQFGLLDLERGAKISGSGFIVFRKQGARLVRALMNFMLDLHTGEHGYEETWVPAVVNRASMIGTAQFPKFEDEQYALRDEELFLIPTAEVPVTNLYRDEILPEAELPKAFVAYSPCFRREAGSHGKDTRGLLRVHEFDKVELVRYCTPDASSEQHELITAHAERVLQLLELPYRVLLLAAGDTGFASAKTYDLEVFAPGVGKWLEVSSSSTFTDFQGRRANIRYRPTATGKPKFVHTLNASGVAFPRIIASILEHHQCPDGTVTIPAALRPYFGSDIIG